MEGKEIDIDDWAYASEIPVLEAEGVLFIWNWRDNEVATYETPTTMATPYSELEKLDSYSV